jgi:endo-1,4-beta-xylanase
MRFLTCGFLAFFMLAPSFAQQPQPMTLRQAAGARLLIGVAIMSSATENPQRAALIAEQFNCLTGENEFKPDSLEHVQGKFNFAGADKIIAFAQQHDMKVVGHNLCWHQQSPPWMFADAGKKPLPREQALANLKSHIDAVVKHFKGNVIGWDVVNEAIGDSPNEFLRDTPAHRAIGDDYVEKAFELAHAADPSAELYYNDYNIETPGKREKAIKLIRSLKAKGLRIDAVGIQGHWQLNSPDTKMIDSAISAFADVGVKVMITELDIDVLPRKASGADISATEKVGIDPYKNGCPPAVLEEQAKRYGELFAVFMKHRDDVTRITFWGIDDGTSWLNNWPVRGRTNYPLLWDRQCQAKPAFFAVLKSIS